MNNCIKVNIQLYVAYYNPPITIFYPLLQYENNLHFRKIGRCFIKINNYKCKMMYNGGVSGYN